MPLLGDALLKRVVGSVLLAVSLQGCPVATPTPPLVCPTIPATAEAGPDVEVTLGEVLTIDGRATGAAAVWWTHGVAGSSVPSAFTLANEARLSVTTTRGGPMPLVFAAMNPCGQMASDAVLVTVLAPPVASPGSDQTRPRGATVTLDGSASTDANGDALTYRWSVTGPAGEAVSLQLTAAQATFVPTAPGAYTATLIVNDGRFDSAPGSARITVTNSAPAITLVAPAGALRGEAVSLSGVGSDPEGDALTISWELVALPSGSAAVLASQSGSTTSFTADLEGDYRVRVTVNDGLLTAQQSVSLTAFRPISQLAYGVSDARYSRSLDRLVIVSAQPNVLHLLDPVTLTESTVTLPDAPSDLSVSPNGQFAAVGHAASVSWVNLNTRTLASVPTTYRVGSLVLADTGRAYLVSRAAFSDLHTLNLSTGADALTGMTASVTMELHPSGTRLYSASTSDLARYNVNNQGNAVYAKSVFWETFPGCGDALWFTEGGDRIIGRCGSVVPSSATLATDLMDGGSALDPELYFTGVAHSVAAQEFVATRAANPIQTSLFPDPEAERRKLTRYASATRLELNTRVLPLFVRDGGVSTAEGRFVFFNSAGTRVFVLVKIDATAATPGSWGLVSY